ATSRQPLEPTLTLTHSSAWRGIVCSRRIASITVRAPDCRVLVVVLLTLWPPLAAHPWARCSTTTRTASSLRRTSDEPCRLVPSGRERPRESRPETRRHSSNFRACRSGSLLLLSWPAILHHAATGV